MRICRHRQSRRKYLMRQISFYIHEIFLGDKYNKHIGCFYTAKGKSNPNFQTITKQKYRKLYFVCIILELKN